MKVINLFSGSKGNCTYIDVGKSKILIDVGSSYKQINNELLMNVGIDLNDIDVVLISHSHTDHISALDTILSRHDTITAITHKTVLESLKLLKKPIKNIDRIKTLPSDTIKKGEKFSIYLFELKHDVPCYGFIIFDNEDNSLVHVSDNGGYMDRVLLEKLHNHTYYLIESNYDEYMQIIDTTRNEKLKRRVLGAWGHTSNVQAMSNFFKLVGERTKGLMFTHLSEHCNSLDIAKNTHDNLIDIWGKNRELKNVTIKYANQSNSTEM